MDKKCIIVNADDFGLCEKVNNGIIKAFQDGIVTSTSLLATGSAFEHAVELAKKNLTLPIGVHLCLLEEKAILKNKDIPSLVDENGIFFRNWIGFFLGVYFRHIDLLEVEKELDAQIKKVIDSGINPTHIDSHQHTHIIPAILNIVIRLAKKYNIRFIRYPLEKIGTYNFLSRNHLKMLLLHILSYMDKNMFKNNSIAYVDNLLGINFSGKLDLNMMVNFINRVNQNAWRITEIICHPGESNFIEQYSHWNYNWEIEMNVLLDERIRKLIQESNIILSDYGKL